MDPISHKAEENSAITRQPIAPSEDPEIVSGKREISGKQAMHKALAITILTSSSLLDLTLGSINITSPRPANKARDHLPVKANPIVHTKVIAMPAKGLIS